MSNTFGFGGHNTSAIFKKVEWIGNSSFSGSPQATKL
jgi:hypothetical protein